MTHPRVLITGAGGQVGRALRPLLPEAKFATRAMLDVTEPAALREAAKGCDVIIHLAANTHVDRCEVEAAGARLVNAIGTRNVSDAAADTGARVIYVSTDYVFDGAKPNEYAEQDQVRPLNVYGNTKLEGENHLDASRDLIVRSSWIFGEGRNFIRAILAAAPQGVIRVVDDQRGRPTAATDLAAALRFLLLNGTTGLLHVAGDGDPCTWADLAQHALSAAGSPATIDRIDTSTYVREANKTIAPRPPNSALALDNARELGVPLLDWRASVERYVRSQV